MVSSLPFNAPASLQSLETSVLTAAGKRPRHIVLTSHPGAIGQQALTIHWGAVDPMARGPVVATVTDATRRNAIGTHAGGYAVYQALAVARGNWQRAETSAPTHADPAISIGPYPNWFNEPQKKTTETHAIVSLDPFGAQVAQVFRSLYQRGFDIRPTITITKTHIQMPELQNALQQGWLEADGQILLVGGELLVTKAVIEPVWYLPGIAVRLGVDERALRHALFEQTGGMFPELITRPDLKVFLPPIGNTTVYIVGNPEAIRDPQRRLAVRIHDECPEAGGLGTDVCTCRADLVQSLEICVETAQSGGAGVIVYARREGQALVETTEGVSRNPQNHEFQVLMPDVLHWLGITCIDQFISMSELKYEIIVKSGIEIIEQISFAEEFTSEEA